MTTTVHPLHKFRFCPVCGSEHFNENNALSKRCADCGFTYYFNPRGAVAVLITNGRGDLLVARRGKEPAKGTLDLPGGFIDLHETAEEAAIREVREETGLTVKRAEYLLSEPNIYPYSGLEVHTIDLFFRCEADTDEPVRAMDDVAELLWVPLANLNIDDFGFASIRKGLKRYLSML